MMFWEDGRFYPSLGTIFLPLALVGCNSVPVSEQAQPLASSSITVPTASTLPSSLTPLPRATVNPANANLAFPINYTPVSEQAHLPVNPLTTAPTKSVSPSLQTPSALPPTSNPSATNLSLPLNSSSSVLPDAITTEEVALREQQVQVAKKLERDFQAYNAAGIATSSEVLQMTYFRLNSEIQLLQAKQLLQLKQKQDQQKN